MPMEERELFRDTLSSSKQRKNVMDFDKERRKTAKRKNKRRDYEKEEDVEYEYRRHKREDIMPKWKLVAVGGAIFLCFALLYPSVFAPLFNNFLGGGRIGAESDSRTVHPSMTGSQQRGSHPGRPPPPATIRASEQQQQQAGTGLFGGSGRGGFAWLLPFYTIGVVCFLLYTLFKIMFKSKRKEKRHRPSLGLMIGDSDDTEEEVGTTKGSKSKLRSVQARLRKTELAMAEILQQLETISAQSQQFKAQKVTIDEAMVKSAEERQRPNDKGLENSKEQGATDAEGTNNENTEADNVFSGLTTEQTAQVERSLRELKILSELCERDQRQRRRLRTEGSSSTESDVEDAVEDEEFDSQTEEEDLDDRSRLSRDVTDEEAEDDVEGA